MIIAEEVTGYWVSEMSWLCERLSWHCRGISIPHDAIIAPIRQYITVNSR